MKSIFIRDSIKNNSKNKYKSKSNKIFKRRRSNEPRTLQIGEYLYNDALLRQRSK